MSQRRDSSAPAPAPVAAGHTAEELLAYPHDAPLVHVERPDPIEAPSFKGMKASAKRYGRKLKLAAGSQWTKMKQALKDNDKKTVEKLLKGGFNVLERQPSKDGDDVTTLKYVEELEKKKIFVKPDIVRLLKLAAE